MPRRSAKPGPRGAIGLAALGLATVGAVACGLLDVVSFVITVGGSLGVTAVTFSWSRLAATVREIGMAVAPEPDPEAQIAAFKRLARIHRLEGTRALERAAHAEADPFVRRAVLLAADGHDPDTVERQLAAEMRRHVGEVEDARLVLVTLGRLFPAFGLIGTLVGLVALLRTLGDGGLASLARGLGIAVQTTLYGALMSNVIVLPLATRLAAHAARRTRRLQMTLDGALLVARHAFPSQIDAVLRAHFGTPPPEPPRAPSLRLAERAA